MQRYIVLLLALCTIALSAQETVPKGKNITLPEAKALAQQNNHDFASAEAALYAAKWNKAASYSGFLPSLSFSGTYLYMDPATTISAGNQSIRLNNDNRSMAFNLSQTLFAGGRIYNANKIAATALSIQELSLKNMKLKLDGDTESKYYAALQLKSVLDIANKEVVQAERSLTLATLKQENGIISRADFLRFKANLANKEIAKLQAETALQIALKDFNHHLGSTDNIPEEITMDKSETERFAGILDSSAFTQKASQIATKQNLSLQILERSLELSDRAYKIAKGSFLPSLVLTGSHQLKENGIDRYQFASSNQLMLNVSVPILPQVGNYANAKKAYFEQQKAISDVKSASNGIDLGLEAAALNLISTARQVKSAQISLSLTEEMYQQLSERYNQNMISAMEFMDAEVMLSASRMAYNNAFYSFLKARLALLNALGTQDIDTIYTIIED